MVSTRQMTIGNNITGEGTSAQQQQQQVCFEGPAKYTRSVTTTAGCSGMGGTLQSVRELPSSSQQVQHTTCFMDLPQEVVEKILSYLTFKNISALRFVCRRIDHICGQLLNSTFLKLQTKMLLRFQEIKSKMPRRESARRSHYLACESDIIETLHMRLTLLQMSFGKHIERKHCCFFPGEILDEVYRILHYIKTTPKLDLPYKVTDELFDLSTMAMEYFKEKIEPNLPEIAYFSTDFLNFTGSSSSKYLGLESSKALSDVSKDSSHNDPDALDSGEDLVETLPQSNMVLRKRIRKIKQGMKRYNSQLSLLRQDLRSCKKKTADQQKQISEQQKQLSDQQNQTIEYASRLDEYDKKNEEISRKFSTLLQELNKCKTELQYWRCKSPATPPCCTNCGNPVAPKPEELQALLNQGVDPEGLRLEPPGSDLMQTDQCSSGSGSSNSSNCIPKPEEEKDISQKDTVEGKDKERVKPEAIVKEKQEASKIPTVSQGMPAQIGRHTKRKSEEAKEDQQQQQQMTPKKTRRLSKMRSTNKRAKV